MAIDDWSTGRLAELTSKVGSGATPRGGANSYKDEGISLIRSLNVYDLRFELPRLALVDQTQADELDNVEVLSGDVLLNITGASVARCCLVPDRVLPARVNQHVSIVRPNREALDSRFLAYSLVSPLNKSRLLAVAQGGATREALTKQKIEDFEILVPPLATQRKIAGILAAHDELIENNLRRIEILEEMAQAIYREWFVNFRYPGHEADNLVDSPLGPIPKGWEVSTLGEESSVVMGQSPKSEFYNDEGLGLPFHQGVTYFGTLFPEHVKHCTVESRIAEAGDALVSVRAPVGRINVADTRMVIGRGLAAVRSLDDCRGFHFRQLRHVFRDEDSMGGGTIYKAITKGDLVGVQWLVPPLEVKGAFDSLERPLFSVVSNLIRQNANLRTTRDLLLPKLVSGEIDVSDLDIDTSWLAT